MSRSAKDQLAGVGSLIFGALLEPEKIPERLFAGDGSRATARSSPPAPPARTAARPPPPDPADVAVTICGRCLGEGSVVRRGQIVPCECAEETSR